MKLFCQILVNVDLWWYFCCIFLVLINFLLPMQSLYTALEIWSFGRCIFGKVINVPYGVEAVNQVVFC